MLVAMSIAKSGCFGKIFLSCYIIQNSDKCISVSCKCGMVEDNFVISAVYAKCSRGERMELWNDLEGIASTLDAWLVGGDFNIVREVGERFGGNSIDYRAANDFNDCIARCGFT